jgi:hypothetical protein
VTSNFGLSSFLRRSHKIKTARNTSVLKLKGAIEDQFPGNPPVGLQTLYLDSRVLRNEDILGNLTNKMLLPLQLDLLSGVMMYNMTSSFSVSKAIDAYVSLCVHEAYLHNKLTEVITAPPRARARHGSAEKPSPATATAAAPDSLKYRQLYQSLNGSFYRDFGPAIARALEAEKNPSVDSHDSSTRRSGQSWIGGRGRGRGDPEGDRETNGGGQDSAMKDFFAQQLILSDVDVRKLTSWSIFLTVIDQCPLSSVGILCGHTLIPISNMT